MPGEITIPNNLQINASEWEVPTYEKQEFASKQHRFCVCIPVINEGMRIQVQLQKMHELGTHKIADVLIADGGSSDGSLAALERLKLLGVRALLTKTGPGKLSAQLRMAYSYALIEGYEGIVTIDGNNKDGPESIPQFLQELEQGVDLVQGSRFVTGGKAVNTPLLRTLAIRLIHAPLMSLASGFHYTDTTNGFRGYSRNYLLDPRVLPFREVFQTYELLTYLSVRGPQLGYRTKEIPVSRIYPSDGPTPTKLNHRGHWDLLSIVFRTLFGSFHPKVSAADGN